MNDNCSRMNDNEIIKAKHDECEPLTTGSTYPEKIRAIDPHIVVDNNADKPYYSIRYYDVDINQWCVGYSSYNLSFVVKWLQECFDIVDSIGHFVSRMHEELANAHETIEKQTEEIETLKSDEEKANTYCKDVCEPKYKSMRNITVKTRISH